MRSYNRAGDSSRDLPWGALDDVVMGGVSESTFRIDPTGGENGKPTGLFTGLSSQILVNYIYILFDKSWLLVCAFQV